MVTLPLAKSAVFEGTVNAAVSDGKKFVKSGILNTQLLIKDTTHKINMLIHMFFLANYLNI